MCSFQTSVTVMRSFVSLGCLVGHGKIGFMRFGRRMNPQNAVSCLAVEGLGSARRGVDRRRCSGNCGAAEIQIQRLQGENSGISAVLMNRPHARNSLGNVFVTQLEEAVEDLCQDKSVRVVLFKSQIKGVFCAGADLKERAQMSNTEVGHFVRRLQNLMNNIASSAKMGLIEVTRGLLPGAGGSQRLPRTVGIGLAKELIFTGRQIDGEQAMSMGLVNNAVRQNDLGDAAYQKALDLAKEILPQGPVALRMAKQAMNRGIEVDIASGMAIEGMCYAQVIPTKDRLEGMAAFKEKRLPHFIGE
ncbi:enoyl-CoA hydratase domain-containing protein 2, mitochondrial isoform X2 [Stegostoma tigrinum]|uniref:enoyl-CoA hydratase domain-containing protein 2, mitochondrial isoform X2 n=1 Tax=Stegostoma tigrinum TaxID=3053191 RepID=UPI00202AF742|nr:enoyl-CoA hydratase domain-containing protein 2, mitochondrial isoform X2 [Stegostoma tigrinum]